MVALIAAMMTVATAAPAFAAGLGQTAPNKETKIQKQTPNATDSSGLTETSTRKGNTNTFTKSAGNSPDKSVTCTNREVKQGTCP
jgi:hypothetical protein